MRVRVHLRLRYRYGGGEPIDNHYFIITRPTIEEAAKAPFHRSTYGGRNWPHDRVKAQASGVRQRSHSKWPSNGRCDVGKRRPKGHHANEEDHSGPSLTTIKVTLQRARGRDETIRPVTDWITGRGDFELQSKRVAGLYSAQKTGVHQGYPRV